VAWVENLLAAGRQAIEEPLTARVVLPDYKLDNATAQRFGGRWAISGVFDLMEAFMGDGEMSLCRQFGTYLDEGQPALAGEYVRGYLTLRPSRPGFAERFRAYMLADRLIVWEYGQRHPESGWWKTRLTLREYIDPYLDAATDFR
jgi:hypothetical protein